jgi:hypothetical protein
VYAVSPITFTTFPTGSLDVTPSFTNPFYSTPWPDDGSVGPIPIGFSFDYFCNTYTDIHICSNGFIMLDYQPFPWPTQYVHPTQNIPDNSNPNGIPDGIIAFNMTDLLPGTGSSITYTTVGTPPNRMFIVTYSNVPCFTTPSDLNTGQIVFYETSNIIEIHTTKARPDVNQGTAGSTQGIENTTGTIAFTPPGRNQNNTWGANADNTAYQFSPFTPAPPAAVTGPTALCQGQGSTYNATFISTANSYNWTLPSGWTGTSSNYSIATTAGASGVLSVSATYTCGTSAPTTLSVNVVPAPFVGITSLQPNVICSGSSVNINVTGGVNYTLDPGGISGTSPLVDFPMVTTVYTLTGENSAGCLSFNTATATIIVKTTPTVTVNSGTICAGETFSIVATGADYQYTYSSTFPTISPPAGIYTYSVTGTNTNGCVSAPAISNLTVTALPSVSLVANRQVICLKEPVNLTAGGATTYTWTNSTASGSLATFSPTTATIYTVTGYNPEGCSKTATVQVLVNPCVGIDESSMGSLITVYPNPSNGEFNIEIAIPSTLYVYNILGQQVHMQELKAGTNTIRMTEQAAGKYFLKAVSGDNQKTMLIIKN